MMPAGHRLADAERIADREHEIADFKIVSEEPIGSAGRSEGGSMRSKARSAAASAPTTSASKLAPIVQHHHDLVRLLDDVVIGDDQPVRFDDHAGAERILLTLGGRRPTKALVAEERIGEEGIAVEQRRLDPCCACRC